jgi:heavy metal sensor kinase
MNARSIRFRLIAWYASLLTCVFLLLAVLMFLGLRHYLEAGLGENQARRARQIADTLLTDIRHSNESYLAGQIEALYAPEINDRFMRITHADGHVVYVSDAPKDQSFDSAGVPALTSMPAAGSLRKQKLPGGKTLLIAARAFRGVNGQRYLVEVGAPTTPIETMLSQLLIQLSIGLPIVVLAAIGGGFLLVGRALAPVGQIARKAEQITQHNLSERLPVPRTADELERLSVSLNHMIARLEEAVLNSKRFVADASHELRTPLTVLRAELESVVQDEAITLSMRETLGSLLEEVERLAKIVERLFALSRLDAGEAQAEWVQFDLGKLATTTADQMSLLAEDKGIAVSCNVAEQITVEGDRARLKQVVVNLLDNAIKYTSRGGTVHLKVGSTNGHAVLEVADSGIGIPADALPHVFDRFFRVDKARGRDPGGTGLGLSIVKSICAAHGAEVEAESASARGSCFRVKLPLVHPCGQ